MKTVSHYGIHWSDEGVAFLEQGRSGTNAVGLKAKSPFRVQLASKKRHCNHQVSLNAPIPADFHWDYFNQLLDDDLMRAALPIPKLDGGVYFVEQNETVITLFHQLSRMSSPIHSVVLPIWTIDDANTLYGELQATNVQPLFLTGVEPKHSSLISDIAKAAVVLPRKLILSGSPDVIVPSSAKRIATKLDNPELINLQDFSALPWEQLGATVIRKHMRRELKLPNTVRETVQSRAGRATERKPIS